MPNDGDGRSATAFLHDWRSLALVPSISTFAALVAYISLLAALEYILPGKRIAGALLADGTRLTYKCNGLLSLLALLLFLGLSVSPAVVAERGLEFLVTTFLLCVLVSLVTFICGRRSSSKAASFKPHLSGNLLNDWWLGVQLNPQFLGFDLKFLWIRAGMIGWLLINLSIAAKQIQLDGSLSFPMALFQFFSAIYVLDYFWHEEYMTSTWDIIAENFGFMLIFGDLVWVPFTFSIQGWWLLRNKVELTWTAAVANIFVFIIGYILFRGANKQKHIFKKDPKAPIWGQPPKVIGGKLLASGYWGIARHCNYLGDLLLALSFSLPCGTRSVIPYFYPIYLFILLIWRERRDEARCREKYKEVWVDYCKIVPWRIFPGIY